VTRQPGSFSVIIPCYNYGRYLRGCVESVISQDGVDVAVLVIDDCSTDDSAEVGAIVAADPRVTFRRHDHNVGHIATYNEGLEWADGDYTVLLSADDLLTPGALARAASVLDDRPGVGLVYGRAIRFEHEPPPIPQGAGRAQQWSGRDWIERRCRTASCTIASPEVTVRTALYRSLGGYRPDLPHTADLEMWLRIAAHADVVYLRGGAQAYYRVHQSSMSRTEFGSALADLQGRKASFDVFFDNCALEPSVKRGWRAQVERALARESLWRACRAYDRRRLQSVSTDELEQFATATYSGARKLREYYGLRMRRSLGPDWCPRVQWLLPSVYVRRLRDRIWWYRLSTSGV